MTFEIAWGYRLGQGTLGAALYDLDGRRREAGALIRREIASELAFEATAAIDASALRGEAWGDALAAAATRLAQSPSPHHDFSFKVAIIPHGGSVYAAGILSRRAYGEWLSGLPGYEDYSWHPDEAPAVPGWDGREAAWRAILAKSWRLSECGPVVEFQDTRGPIGDEEVALAAPARDRRVERAARHAALEARTLATGNTIPAAIAAADWIRTAEGVGDLAARAELARAALPDITASTLRGNP